MPRHSSHTTNIEDQVPQLVPRPKGTRDVRTMAFDVPGRAKSYATRRCRSGAPKMAASALAGGLDMDAGMDFVECVGTHEHGVVHRSFFRSTGRMMWRSVLHSPAKGHRTCLPRYECVVCGLWLAGAPLSPPILDPNSSVVSPLSVVPNPFGGWRSQPLSPSQAGGGIPGPLGHRIQPQGPRWSHISGPSSN